MYRNCLLILTSDLHYAKNYFFAQSVFVKSSYQAYIDTTSVTMIALIRDGVHSGWCPFGMMPIRDDVCSGLCSFGIVFIRDGVHA